MVPVGGSHGSLGPDLAAAPDVAGWTPHVGACNITLIIINTNDANFADDPLLVLSQPGYTLIVRRPLLTMGPWLCLHCSVIIVSRDP